MTTPGFFELYSTARPALRAGPYTAVGAQELVAQTPHDGDATVPIDDAAIHLLVDSPRYAMPPDQILSTFPPAGSSGDWRERLPQIVLKRRTLPWERNPDPAADPKTSPPWLALVVLAEGEGTLSSNVEPAKCVSSGVTLSGEADVPTARYLEVTQDIVDRVFPCRDELHLLCHVRKVDLSDTELALGDDDGYLAVVLSSRLPQPLPPTEAGQEARPLKYTAYLLNLERQIGTLLPTEPAPVLFYDTRQAASLVDQALLTPAANATLDQIAMQLGSGAKLQTKGRSAPAQREATALQAQFTTTKAVPFGTGRGIEGAAGAWRTGPTVPGVATSSDLTVARDYKSGIGHGLYEVVPAKLRFPVLVSWDFTCTADGGFERLMSALDVGLLGTVDQASPPPGLEVTATGHVALAHRSRRGEAATSWYRGPLSPQPTARKEAVAGVLPLAHTSDQLRKVVPDGREDISQAALFEIGRLLTLNKPTLVAELMQWRRELFGAARARELADRLVGSVIAKAGLGAAAGRDALEALIRTSVVGAFTAMPPERLAPAAPPVTSARVPEEVVDLAGDEVLGGLGINPAAVARTAKQYGVDGLGAVPVLTPEAPTEAAAKDQEAMASLNLALGRRVDALVTSALKVQGPPPKGERLRRARKKDTLDRLITRSEERLTPRDDDGRR